MVEAMIEIEGLWYRYSNGHAALRDVNMRVARGEFVALIGQNGAGKSTLVKHLNGLHRPTRGRVLIDGIDTRRASTWQLARKVGHVFQNPDHQIFNESVWEEVCYGPRNLGYSKARVAEAAEHALQAVGLLALKERHPYSLSKGQRQWLAIASVLSMEPEILVIDEPTTGQDRTQCARIMELVCGLHLQGRTILMVTHDMRIVAEHARRVVLMKDGQILLDGSPREVLSDFERLRETRVTPPQVTRVGAALGLPRPVLTEAEAYEELVRWWKLPVGVKAHAGV